MRPSPIPTSEQTLSGRVSVFLQKTWSEKFEVVRFYLGRPFSAIPTLVELPFGGWWLAWRDRVSPSITGGQFEAAEQRFVKRYLQQGMTVLDIGAHHGFYSVLASKCVGPCGRVLAFEPSSRERRRLMLNLWLNRAANVSVEKVALGVESGEAEFFRVDSGESGCNSLRRPVVDGAMHTMRVRVERLDDVLQQQKIQCADFVKLDVEGAELTVLRGAERFLAARPRPVLLVEISDLRTAPWGYPARQIVQFLRHQGFAWFRATEAGWLEPAAFPEGPMDANFIAVPQERLVEVQKLHSVCNDPTGGMDGRTEAARGF
jgi:FkbM family methyltransferase